MQQEKDSREIIISGFHGVDLTLIQELAIFSSL